MKVSTLAAIAHSNTASQEEYQLTVNSKGDETVYFGTDLQAALKLNAGDNVFIGISEDRKVLISATERAETPHSLKLNRSNPSCRNIRAYVKKGMPSLPKVRRSSSSITVQDGIASFNY